MTPPTSPNLGSLSAAQHVKGAEDFAALVDHVKVAGSGPEHIRAGWAITLCFYAALHWTRAYLLAVHNVSVKSHEEMGRHERQFGLVGRAKRHYDFLKQQSHSARYYINPRFTLADVDAMKVKASLVRSIYEAEVRAKLQ